MQGEDLLRKVNSLCKAAQICGQQLTSTQIDGYIELLAEVSAAQIDSAMTRWLRESSFYPKPADILRLCGRGPDDLAAKAWEELLPWLVEWGTEGQKTGEPEYERSRDAGGYEVVRVKKNITTAPPLPRRTISAVIALAGGFTYGLRRIQSAQEEPEKLARVQADFVRAWKAAL